MQSWGEGGTKLGTAWGVRPIRGVDCLPSSKAVPPLSTYLIEVHVEGEGVGVGHVEHLPEAGGLGGDGHHRLSHVVHAARASQYTGQAGHGGGSLAGAQRAEG